MDYEGCGEREPICEVRCPKTLRNTSQHRRAAILVLGVARSGTSVLAHVLNVLGAALPEQLLGASHGNPLGHWEPARLLQINEEILGSIGRSWPDPRAISADWFRSKTAYEFQERIVAEIARSYGDAPLIVIKEPRICRIAPLYLDALDVLNIEPLVVLPVRHPAEVIQSISERDGNDQRTDELIWLRDLIEAEHASRATLRVWTSFEHLLADWQGTAQSISSKLGITWPNQPDIVAAEVGRILKPRHRHYQAPSDSVSLPLGDWAVQTWRAAQYALSGNEPQAQDLFDRIRKAICEFDRLNVPQQEWIERRLTEMTQTIEAMNREIVAIHASRSWRITAPLRAVKKIFS
jgi:hypothetical protein